MEEIAGLLKVAEKERESVGSRVGKGPGENRVKRWKEVSSFILIA